MPIVNVQLFPGRTTVMKEFLSRAIVDAVSEIAGPARDLVYVLFHEVPTSEWAIGPSLVSSQPAGPAPEYVPALITTERVTVKEGHRSEYISWRRESLFPFLATQQGFLASSLAAVPDTKDDFLIIEKWISPHARDEGLSRPEAAELRDQEAQFLAGRADDQLAGRVVDVFRGRG
jgi:4-oxalocrotonate tautomerase family enzyme